MDIFKNKKGITLVSLVVTIIILMILAGITLTMVQYYFNDRIVSVSNKVTEATLQEKIEMAWSEVEASYWIDKNNISINKSEYFQQKLKEKLENMEDIENVTASGNANENVDISFLSNGQKYEFEVSAQGGVKRSNKLKGNVKIGDYIEYPKEYKDIYSEKQYTSTNGWRVIDDGIMEGTSGYVKMISTGIPARWYYDMTKYPNNQLAIDDLMNNFENIILLTSNNGTEMKGSEFKNETIAEKISTVSLSDINEVCNVLYKTDRDLKNVDLFEDKYELFHLKDYERFEYWLATEKKESNEKIYYVSEQGIAAEGHMRMGIRPVIYLKNSLEGKLENNVWKIIN